MMQGGDYQNSDGTGGECSKGGKMTDEGFPLKHDSRGVLSMANSGPNTNGSQFFITLAPCQHLDGKHVAFGRVSSGLSVLESIDDVETDARDRPVTLETVKVLEAYEGEPRKRRRGGEGEEGEEEGRRSSSWSKSKRLGEVGGVKGEMG